MAGTPEPITQTSQDTRPFCLSTSGSSFRNVCVIILHRLVIKCRREFVQETSGTGPATECSVYIYH